MEIDMYILTMTDSYDNDTVILGVFDSLDVLNREWRNSPSSYLIDKDFIFTKDVDYYRVDTRGGYCNMYEYEVMILNQIN